jgi:hypothetical protein
MLPPDDRLKEELLVLSYELKDGKIKITPKDKMKALLGGRSPDALDALALSFYRADIDTRLDFYQHVKYGVLLDDGKVQVPFEGSNLIVEFPEINKDNLISGDIAFISCDVDTTYWTWFRASVIKTKEVDENLVLIHEIQRFTRDTKAMLLSLLEANQKRKFRSIYTWKSEQMKREKKTFNTIVNDFYAINEKKADLVPWPGISSLKLLESISRNQKHSSYLKDALENCIPVILNNVSEYPQVWQQMSSYDSIPDDARDALIGLLTLAAKE